MFMTWEYALIGLVVGIIIGAVAMRFGNRKLRQQQALQYELEKNKAELDEYREELVSHFARSAELLDTMAHDYRQLYQHMAKSSSSLLPELSAEANPFRNRLAESEARAFSGLKPATNHKKGSIFDPDFSIILRPHVTRKFFSQNFLCAGIGYSKG
jgi:uncharacterized protein